MTGGVRDYVRFILPPPQCAHWGTPLINAGGKVAVRIEQPAKLKFETLFVTELTTQWPKGLCSGL